MKKNLVPLDRAVRASAGLFLLATPILNLATFPYNLLGFVLMATAAIGYCPLYSVARAIVPRRTPKAPSPTGFGGFEPPHGQAAR